MSLQPTERSTGVHTVKSVELDSGQKATITFTPERSGSTISVPTLAVSKRNSSSYEMKIDGSNQFGPAEVPPTDIDDLAQPFPVPVEFETNMKVIIKNLSSTDRRTYHIQLIGWEDT